jgi:hypothetical protein
MRGKSSAGVIALVAPLQSVADGLSTWGLRRLRRLGFGLPTGAPSTSLRPSGSRISLHFGYDTILRREAPISSGGASRPSAGCSAGPSWSWSVQLMMNPGIGQRSRAFSGRSFLASTLRNGTLPGVSYRAHVGLSGYQGFWCFRRNDRVVVSAPSRWLDRLEVLIWMGPGSPHDGCGVSGSDRCRLRTRRRPCLSGLPGGVRLKRDAPEP